MSTLVVRPCVPFLIMAVAAVASTPAAFSLQTRQATWTEAYDAYSRGDYRRAESLFRDLVEDHPGWGYARYMLALTLQRLGRGDEALSELRRGERRADDPESRLLTQRARAEIRLERGEYDEAIEAGRQAERLLSTLERREPVPDRNDRALVGGIGAQRVAVTEILASGYLRQERWQEANEYLERLTELRPADPEAFSMLGRVRYQLGAPARALEAFERSLELDPSNVEALRHTSRIHLEQGRHEQAFAAARRGLRQRPGDGELFETLGRAAMEMGRHREAAEALEVAARQRPLSGSLRCRLGDAYLQLEEPERATEHYRAARDLLEPRDELLPRCLRGLATAYEEAGRDREALEAYEDLLEVQPSADVATDVARLRRVIGRAGPPSPGTGAGRGGPDAPGTVLRSFDGTGTRSTRPFEVEGRWEIRWTSSQGIRILLFSAAGEEIGVAAEQGTSGSGSTFEPEGGAYFLRIEATGEWEVRIVDLEG